MAKKIIGTTRNGISVYYGEETLKHLEAHQGVSLDLIKEAIERLNYKGPFTMVEVKMGRIIGKDKCVSTLMGERCEYLYRKGRDYPSRIYPKGKPEDTEIMTVGICTDDDGLETLFTAFPGQKAPKEELDPRLTEEEKPLSYFFWATNALVCSPEEIDFEKTAEHYKEQLQALF